jgi:hypothetical protein
LLVEIVARRHPRHRGFGVCPARDIGPRASVIEVSADRRDVVLGAVLREHDQTAVVDLLQRNAPSPRVGLDD